MTQLLSKQTPSLVVVNRNSKAQASARATDDTVPVPEALTTPVEDVPPSNDEAFAGFVFEEVSGTAPVVPAREAVPTARAANTQTEPSPATGKAPSQTASNAPVARASAAPKAQAKPAAPAPSAPVNEKEPEPKRISEERSIAPKAEAQATSSPPPAAVRLDLELRAKLNHKEAELLSLRSELSARDRLVLDLNNAALEIERSRTELSEQLEQTHALLQETLNKLRSYEADKEALAKRIEDMKVAVRRNEESTRRKHEAELTAMRNAHATALTDQAASQARKLEQLEQEKAAEIARLESQHAAATEAAKDKHNEAMRSLETASSKALANAVSAYTRKVRALQETQEQALSKALAADAAKLEAALAVASSDKASAMAEADSALRATQNELLATRTTVDFLQGAHAGQLERVAQQEAKIAALEEAVRRETAKANSAADTLASLRQAFAAGLSVLNAPQRTGDAE